MRMSLITIEVDENDYHYAGHGTMTTMPMWLLGCGLITMLAVWVCGGLAMRVREHRGWVGVISQIGKASAPPPIQ